MSIGFWQIAIVVVLVVLLFGGDDYELIFTSREDLESVDKIGRLTKELGIRVDGEAIRPRGFDHFLSRPES